jgi:hypothetical protein
MRDRLLSSSGLREFSAYGAVCDAPISVVGRACNDSNPPKTTAMRRRRSSSATSPSTHPAVGAIARLMDTHVVKAG